MKLLLCALLSFSVLQITAQSLSVNTDGSTANASAILDVKSTAKGMLVPRMNSVQRTGIGTPATGLLVYDTDSLAFSYYNGSAWYFIKSGTDAGKDWSTRGNAGTTSSNFIGTTDAQDLYFKLANSNAGYLKIAGNTAFGYGAATLTTGLSNTAVGANVLSANTSGTNNIGLGNNALKISAANSDNMAIGVDAMSKITGNSFGNIAIGNNSMINSPKAYDNVAIGQNSLTRINNITSGYGYDNVAIGSEALRFDSAGISNTMVGSKAGRGVTYTSFGSTSNNNTAVGAYAMYYNKFANNNVALGAAALYTDSLGNFNVGVGAQALYLNRSGSDNISLGYKSQYANVSGNKNIAIGNATLATSQTGIGNIAIGDSAMNKTIGISPASVNVAIGSKSLKENIFGYDNVAIGNNTMSQGNANGLNTMARNVAIGFNTLELIGTGSPGSNQASDNTAVGDGALANSTSGLQNTAIGSASLFTSTSGYLNTAVGEQSLFFLTDGYANTAIGKEAGRMNTTGDLNSFLGYKSDVASNNLNNAAALGAQAYVSQSNSMVLGSINGTNSATADTKVGIGVTAPSEKLEIGNGRLRFKGNLASSNAHGITWTDNAGTSDKTFIGIETDNFWGVYNYGLGAWNIRVHNTSGEMGINKQPLTTTSDSRLQVKQRGSQNGIGIETAINTNHWDLYLDNNTAPDFNYFYNGSIRGYIQNATGNYIVLSDKRLKKDIKSLPVVLSGINSLRPYQYHYITNTDTDPLSIGFMAQDVQKLFPDAVSEKTTKDGEKRMGVNYQYFTVLAIKGLQEQQLQIETLKNTNESLQKQIDEIRKMISK